MTSHTPAKCHICEEYHCLAGCVPVEECYKKIGSKRREENKMVESFRHYKVSPEPLSDEARRILTGR